MFPRQNTFIRFVIFIFGIEYLRDLNVDIYSCLRGVFTKEKLLDISFYQSDPAMHCDLSRVKSFIRRNTPCQKQYCAKWLC